MLFADNCRKLYCRNLEKKKKKNSELHFSAWLNLNTRQKKRSVVEEFLNGENLLKGAEVILAFKQDIKACFSSATD